MGDLIVELGKTGPPMTPFPLTLDITKAPHLLVAGMTGSGKSSVVHGILTQLLLKNRSEDLGLLLIDPKRVEMQAYKGLPHMLAAPVYEIERSRQALEWAATEMMIRFEKMERLGARDIEGWNARNQEYAWARIVIVIDELANLMLSNRYIEKPIVRIASMGRAAGLHLVLATQRPSADVLTGLIRANVPTRTCLPVVTKMDSRIVLDEGGGEQLRRPGAMLARLPGLWALVAAQAPLVDEAAVDEALRRVAR